MKISIKNVCNVKESLLSISKNKLNIKYGNNGIGKTSISTAIDCFVNDKPLKHLTPYGTKDNPSVEFIPEVEDGDWKINHTFIFNEEYVKKNLFNKDDTVRNTFEIVVKNENYENDLHAIHSSLERVITIVDNSQFFTDFMSDMDTLKTAINITKDGLFHQRSGFVAGIYNGYSVASVSNGNPLKKHLEDIESAAEWSTWFQEGPTYVKEDRCPYCDTMMDDEIHTCQSEITDKVSAGALSKTMESLTYVDMLCKYLSDEKRSTVMDMIKSEEPLSESEQKYIYTQCYKPLEEEYKKLTDISKRNSYDELMKKVHDNKLNEALVNDKLFVDEVFAEMENVLDAKDEAESLNREIDALIEASDRLARELEDLNSTIRKNIENNQRFVNDFLDNAGLPYEIRVENEDGSYKTRLYPKGIVKAAKGKRFEDGLSYGERNSLSLLLFALEAKNLNPNDNYLIILDDPISSFDNHKKYALLHQLFSYVTDDDGEVVDNLRFKTVLMVTHDFQIAVDLIKQDLLGLVNNHLINAQYLSNRNGIQKETEVTKASFMNRISYERAKAKDTNNSYVCRMLHYRRFLEVRGNQDPTYEQYCSAFLHAKAIPTDINDEPIVNPEKYEEQIKKVLKDFSYEGWMNALTKEQLVEDFHKPASSGLEKLEITRFYVNKFALQDSMEKVFWRYLTETYHIDNDTMSVLDDDIYDSTPQHLIDKCAEIVK